MPGLGRPARRGKIAAHDPGARRDARRLGGSRMTQAPPTGLGWAGLADVDPELWDAMVLERKRQHDKIELIASENYVFAAVLEAQGSWLTNKYAEGMPGKRYYGGCEDVDNAANLHRDPPLAP